MAQEIERKFLVLNNSFKNGATKALYRQGYLCGGKNGIVRVRTIDQKGVLTIKSASQGISRQEFEYEIPFADTEALFALCSKPLIEKYRYTVSFGGMIWEVDEFLGENEGLTIAEIELSEENQVFSKPNWIGIEVSDDLRYRNSNLVRHPFKQW